MLNTQISTTLRGKQREKETEKHRAKASEKTPEKAARADNENCRRKSHVWNGDVQNDCISRNSSNTNFTPDETQSFLDEEKQVKYCKELVNSIEDKGRGYFINSKFNNRAPLSLHPPVSMETENSRLCFHPEEVSHKGCKRILGILEKARVQRNQLSIKKHLERQRNETIGEKTIKLAREKNTLPEVISQRRYQTERRHFLPKLNDQVWSVPSSRLSLNFDQTFSPGHEDVEDLRAPHARKRGALVWSACVFPVLLLEFPTRKTIASLQKRAKRNVDTKRDALKPAAYTEEERPVQRKSGLGRPLSRMMYPSHHGH